MGRGREQISPGVTVRKHKNVETIQLSFMFKGVRCREPLELPPHLRQRAFKRRGEPMEGRGANGA